MSSKKEEASVTQKARRSLVPALRFPEFRDAGEWEGKKLSSIVNLISGLHLSPEEYREVGDVPYFTGPSDFTNRTQEVSKWTGESTSIANENDTLITVKGSGVGEIWYLSLPAVAMGRQLMAVRTINGSSRFIFQFLLTKRTRFEDLASGNLIPGLSRGDILGLEARFPSFLEQQKIADCLSSIDDLITLEARKIEALKAYKKGLMQQLFPAEGETIPKLRFPEFQDAGEWISAKLSDLFMVQSGGTPSRTNPKYWGGSIPWVSTSLVDSNNIASVNEYITQLGLDESAAKIFPKGTILMAMYGQGKTRGKAAILGIDAATNQACAALLPKNAIDTKFIFQNIVSRYEEIRKISNSGGQENLSAGLIGNIPICYPENKREQQKIADCLSSIDDLISLQARKLEALNAHKKGLMQQLFPVSNEVRR